MRVAGHGIYDIAEAADLLGVTHPRLYAWFRGHSQVFRSDYDGLFDRTVLSFLDLVDATVAVTLRERHRVSLQAIRKLHHELAERWCTPHPFGREEFYTMPKGRGIFWRIVNQDREDDRLLEVPSMQHVMPDLMLPFLQRVEYNQQTSLAQSIELLDRVVLDPRRKYGKPTVAGTGMSTAILYECYKATQSHDVVADWYNVSPEDVEAAVRFETEFSGLAA